MSVECTLMKSIAQEAIDNRSRGLLEDAGLNLLGIAGRFPGDYEWADSSKSILTVRAVLRKVNSSNFPAFWRNFRSATEEKFAAFIAQPQQLNTVFTFGSKLPYADDCSSARNA